MSDPYRTDGSHALDAGSDGDRDAKIEQLLLTGLDHYFSAQYEHAINVWTRALFFDRGHARARAYIERARSALAERQRRSEELLQDGVAAFQRGDGREARRLLRAAIDEGAPADEALTVLNRLDRLEWTEAPAPASRGDGTPRAPARRAVSVRAASPPRRRAPAILAAFGLVLMAAVAAGAVWAGWSWPTLLSLASSSAPVVVEPPGRDLSLSIPRRGEIVLARAEALAAGGHLHDALAVLARVRSTDLERAEADRLRVKIQRELLALAGPPAPPARGTATPQEALDR